MKSHTKNILIYYTEYVTIKEYVKSYSVNPLYLVFRNGYFEEIDKSKYLTLVPTNKSKEKKYEELWSKIRDLIRSIAKSFVDHELPLNKTIEVSTLTIVVRATFLGNNNYYPQVFFDECLYKI